MTTRKKAKYPRVYSSDSSWYWVQPGTGKWIRLCRIGDSEETLLERLLAEKKKHARPTGTGNITPLIERYVEEKRSEHKEQAWPSYGKYAANSLRNANIEDIDATAVMAVLKHWKGKLHMQRTMRSFLSGFFTWCIENRKMQRNPCIELKNWLKKPKPSKIYITDAHFAAIRAAMLAYTYTTKAGKTITAKVNTGPMMQCFVDLCYLTVQRSTDIRLLKRSQVDRAAGVIHFLPSKTEDSSGLAVDITITPEIAAVLDRADSIGNVKGMHVIHALNGQPYGATAVRSAWDRAAERVVLHKLGYTVKTIRAKALTDANNAGYDIKALQIAAAHTDPKTTEIYLKQREVLVSDVRLQIPRSA